MRGILRFVLCFGALFSCTAVVSAQGKRDADKAAVLKAIDRFRLSDADATWHLTASVQLLQGGKPGEKGNVEVWHGVDDDRQTVTSFPSFHQISTVTAKGRFHEGDIGDAPAAVGELLHFLERPVKTSTLKKAKLITGYKTVAGQKFRCVHAASDRPEQTFCNVEGSSAIRYLTLPQSVYSLLIEKMGKFQGGDVPLTAVVLFADMPIAHFDLTFDEFPENGKAGIQPGKEAVAVRGSPSTTTARTVTQMISHEAFGTPARLPTVGANVLLRLELDSSGKLKSSEVVATSDEPLTRRVINRLNGRQIVLAPNEPGSRFVNYTIVIPPRDMEDHDNPFVPSEGTNTAYP